jgi:hypothetical protein
MHNKNIDSLARQGSPVQQKSPRTFSRQRYIYLGGAVIAVVIIVLIAFVFFKKRSVHSSSKDTRSQSTSSNSASPQVNTSDGTQGSTSPGARVTLPEYKLIEPAQPSSGQASTGALRYTVITQERSADKLIALNDLLLNQLKDKIDTKRGFFIDYFDNQAIAGNYFAQVADKNVTKAQRDELYNHYVALMVRSDALKMNQLYAQGKDAKIIKQY